MTHIGQYNANVIGFNQAGTTTGKIEWPHAIKKKYEPLILDEKTLMTKQLKTLSPRLRELVEMLTYARPQNSEAEATFIRKFIDTLPRVTVDGFGNRIVQIGKEKPSVCWTSHTDTVHWDEGRQALELNKHGHLCLDYVSQANCLGADCTAGVWLMRRMILAGKKGLYIFHRQEESGGNGSQWIADNTPALVRDIQAMISLDRKGYDSVITEQSTGVTASDDFARSLAAMLPKSFAPDPTGLFTDSAFYSHLIPECTNLSIGYKNCHAKSETLDFRFTDALLNYLLKVDYSKLVIARKPEPQYSFYGYYQADASDRWNDEYMCSENSGVYAPDPSELDGQEVPVNPKRKSYNENRASVLYDHNLAAMVSRYPEAVAVLLQHLELTEVDIYETNAELEEAIAAEEHEQ